MSSFVTSSSSSSLAALAAAAAGKDSSGGPNHAGGGGAGSMGRGGASGNEGQGGSAAEWSARVNGAHQSTNSSTTNSNNNNSTNTGRQSSGPRRPSLSTTLSHHPNHHSHSHNNFITSPLTPSASSSSLNSIGNATSTSSNIYHPPHHYNSQSGGSSNSGGGVGRTYSRDEMLNIFKNMQSSALEKGLQDLLLKRASDGEGGGGKDLLSEVCWVEHGKISGPVALEEMSAEEKELFAGNINSPQKQQNQNQNNQNQGQPHRGDHNNNHNNQNMNTPPHSRKNTVNTGNNNNSREGNNISTTPVRNQASRRPTRDSNDHPPNSPAFHNTPQQPPPSISRRRTDLRGSLSEAFNAGADKEKDKDIAASETSTTPSRPHFGRWGSISMTNTAGGERNDDDHSEPPPSATVPNRNLGLFRRGSAAWGNSSNISAGGIQLPQVPAGGGANAFNNGAFGGGGGFALSGGVPTPLATNSADKKLGSKGGSAKGETTGAEKSTNTGQKDSGGDSYSRSNTKATEEADERERQYQDAIREAKEEEDYNNAMRQQHQQYQYLHENSSSPFAQEQRHKENTGLDDHDERPMSSDTDPYGRRGSLVEYVQNSVLESIKEQQQLPPLNASASTSAIGAEQARLKAASPFSHTSTGDSSVTTPTRNRGELGLGGNYGGGGLGGGLGNLHTQLRDLHINQQGGGNQGMPGQANREMMGGSCGDGLGEHEPLSPTETNPYQSPAPEKEDEPIGGFQEDESGGFVGLSGLGGVIGGGLRREGGPASDRSRGSSTAGLGNGNGLGGGLASLGMSTPGGGLWGTGGLPLGTPDRIGVVNAAPGSFFGLGSDTTGGPSLLSGGSGGYGSVSRASRLGALFPMEAYTQSQQQQPQQQQHHNDEGGMPLDGNIDGFDSFRLGGSGSLGVSSGRRLFQLGTNMGGSESPLRERADTNEFFGLPSTRSLLGAGGSLTSDNQLFSDTHLGGLHGHQGFSMPHSSQQPLSTSVHGGQRSTVVPPTQQGGNVGLSQSQSYALVMPDKIQWEYRDPQGILQGPFSGLEMHDWFKGGYFPQDLHVKRIEDPEFEPLSQLIRRIGNQREPFLVPLQGLAPGGQGSVLGGGPTWGAAPQSAWLDVNPPPGTVQPPFAGSFPSFGTTLTADQQNALEKRKQEEQFIMARQREYLVQQQMVAKQAQAVAIQQQQIHQLPLHPQPSLTNLSGGPVGSGLALGGMGAAAFRVGPIGLGGAQQGANSFEPGVLLRQAADNGFDNRLNELLPHLQQQQHPIPNVQLTAGFVQQTQPSQQFQPQQQIVQQAQQAFHQQQQAHLDRQRQQVVEKQLEEQSQAQEQGTLEQPAASSPVAISSSKQQAPQVSGQQPQADEPQETQSEQTQVQQTHSINAWGVQQPEKPVPFPTTKPVEPATTQTKPKVSSPKPTSPQTAQQPKKASAWNTMDPSPLPAPFPPPPGRATTNTLSLNVDMPSYMSAETPQTSTSVSIAPWAQKAEEISTPKGPSLREIQELEAKQAAALAEAAAAEARKEALTQQVAPQHAPPQPGLPSTATWASSASPANTPPTPLAWASSKPLAKATTMPNVLAAGPKKTLQQIQKEEEAKKAKATQMAVLAATNALVSTSTPAAVSVTGKRYADLAGKPPGGGAPGMTVGGGWTTVGSSGKTKSPLTPGATPATAPTIPPLRSMPSTGVMGSFGKPITLKSSPPGVSTNPPPATLVPSSISLSASSAPAKTPQALAQEEFMKWCRVTLKGLSSNVNQEEFLQSLLSFPPEAEIISDSIYANSATMDGNRFAEEFIRRRKAASQGVVVEVGTVAGAGGEKSGGGWNEVAAKAGRKDSAGVGLVAQEPAAFKVVPGKKKGRR